MKDYLYKFEAEYSFICLENILAPVKSHPILNHPETN